MGNVKERWNFFLNAITYTSSREALFHDCYSMQQHDQNNRGISSPKSLPLNFLGQKLSDIGRVKHKKLLFLTIDDCCYFICRLEYKPNVTRASTFCCLKLKRYCAKNQLGTEVDALSHAIELKEALNAVSI
ncbi:hypothetical protein [Bartonella sp. ML70XJBT.G]|uniref:hypothetical protein n=1 Tax=Bartonella sp. ML70XJBT.G TaxID=3019093 RepID=UPI00235E0079|nr:hypothetical protein [Bartonella sp. ML70XJBT.G]